MKLANLIALVAAFTSVGCHSEVKSQPKFIFTLGTPLSEIKKDANFKTCKFKDNKIHDTQKAEGILNFERYMCKGSERVEHLELSFYNQTLVIIGAFFIQPSPEESAILLINNEKGTSETLAYKEKYLDLHAALVEKCKEIGSSQGEKSLGEGTKQSSGVFIANFSNMFTDNKQYTCNILTEKRERWYEDEKVKYVWIYPYAIVISNVPVVQEAIKKDNEFKESEEAKSRKKFNF